MTPLSDHKLSDQCSYLLQHALLTSKINKRLDLTMSVYGLSFTEFLIMHNLSHCSLKTMRRIELADSVGITASGVTRLLAPMEKNRIVEKEANPRDARQSLVKLTKTGEKLYKDARTGFEQCAEQMLRELSNKQLKTLADLSAKLVF